MTTIFSLSPATGLRANLRQPAAGKRPASFRPVAATPKDSALDTLSKTEALPQTPNQLNPKRPSSKMELYLEQAGKNQQRAAEMLRRARKEAYELPPVKTLKDVGEHAELLLRGVGSFGLNFKHLFELAAWNPATQSPELLEGLLKRQATEQSELLTTQGMAQRAQRVESLLKKLR